MRKLATLATLLLASAAPLAHAAEPDGLVLPPGFHASVVGDVGSHARHIVAGPNGDLYISTTDIKTFTDPNEPHPGILVVTLDADHKLKSLDHFGATDGATGIDLSLSVHRSRCGAQRRPRRDPGRHAHHWLAQSRPGL